MRALSGGRIVKLTKTARTRRRCKAVADSHRKAFHAALSPVLEKKADPTKCAPPLLFASATSAVRFLIHILAARQLSIYAFLVHVILPEEQRPGHRGLSAAPGA
ncbi:hypothetical protein NDU88_006286 [Pleurodeles waltl]|uniref:Uncharacterized protein n=1 Tax=Pleurodeles waltl TaxID=8319 RepID=A0AAV7RPN6_PLEWA|nr:hypothetical protein NDU88_006286 [Pleurodeles waltl]